jgi:4-carboxymuconolactone decarboxylase
MENIRSACSLLFCAILTAGGLAGVHAQTAAKASAVPADIYPESGNRLPLPKPEGMNDADRKIFEEIMAAQKGGLSDREKERPLARMHSPGVSRGLAEAHHYLKYETGLGDRLTTIAVLTASRELTNQFEWTQWEEHARNPKDSRYVEPKVIDAIKNCGSVAGLDAKDAATIAFGRELFGARNVTSETFAKVRTLFGNRGTVDLEELMGLYAATSNELVMYDQQLHAGQPLMLPANAKSCMSPVPVAKAAVAVPADIDPESGNRLPLPKREAMTEADRKVFDEIMARQQTGLSAREKERPQVRMHSPGLSKGLNEAHHYLKYDSGLGDRLMTIAVLTTARELTNQFEWTQWEEHADTPKDSRYVEPKVVEAIRACGPVAGLDEKDAAVITMGRELFGARKVSSETFAKVLQLFGQRGTVDLEELMGLYAATAYELVAFDQQLHAGQKPLLPLNAGSCVK